ncbi:DUF1016 domain-containing protein [Sphingobacterium sp. DR205]|nr:DUF1016 domain-containing protein [Sphingobacterium sp. DR205]
MKKAQYDSLKVVNNQLHILEHWQSNNAQAERGAAKRSIVQKLSTELQKKFPDISGFSTTNLWYMTLFYNEYNDNPNIQPLVGEISWTKHIAILSKCKD